MKNFFLEDECEDGGRNRAERGGAGRGDGGSMAVEIGRAIARKCEKLPEIVSECVFFFNSLRKLT